MRHWILFLLAIWCSVFSMDYALAKDTILDRPLKVGIVDGRVDKLVRSDSKVDVIYREFNLTRPAARVEGQGGYDHGELVASAFVDQMRHIDKDVRVEVYAANAMFERSVGLRKADLVLNSRGSREALRWMRDNGVKVVLTSFVGNDSGAVRGFIDEAASYGMIVFASAGNEPSEMVYPAAYPETISVAADNHGLAFRRNLELGSWVDFTGDGAFKKSGKLLDVGSSFAVARAAAFGAYGIHTGRANDRDSVIALLESVSVPKSYRVQGETVAMPFIDRRNSGEALAPVEEAASASIRWATAPVPAAPLSSDVEPARLVKVSQVVPAPVVPPVMERPARSARSDGDHRKEAQQTSGPKSFMELVSQTEARAR